MVWKPNAVVDIAKPGPQLQNLTGMWNARVLDGFTPFVVQFKENGLPVNLTNLTAFIEGDIGEGHYDSATDDIVMTGTPKSVRYTDDGSGNTNMGIVVFRLPPQFFIQTGIFKGFIGLQSSTGIRSTSNDVWFKVLGNSYTMGISCKYFIGDLDKALQNFKVKLDQHDKDYQTQLQQVIDDARNEYIKQTKASHDANVAADAEIDAIRADAKDLADQIGSQQDFIKAHNIVTSDNFTDLSNNLTKYVTESFVQPEAYSTLADLQKKYPSGAKGIFVVIDTGHFYIWQDNAWKDCGEFQSAGVADKSIHLEKLSEALQNGFYPDVTEVKISNYNTGFTSKLGDFVTNNTSKKEGDPVYTDLINVNPDEEYYVCTQNWWDGKAVIFYSDDKVVASLPDESDSNIKHIKITVPHNVNGIRLNGTRDFRPRLFKINSFFEIPDPIKSIAALIKDKDYTFENVDLTKKNEVGYWVNHNGNFAVRDVDKAVAQISYEPVKVRPFEVYRITGCSAYDARLYTIIDSEGNAISSCQTQNPDNITETVMIPENGAYLEINEYLLNTTTKLERATSVRETLPLDGKKWAAVGDSWTAIYDTDGKSYVNDVAQITGAIGVNLGGGGTGYLTGGPNDWNYQFYKHTIPSDSDICTIFGSFNDAYYGQFKFGQKGDSGTDTLWGALLETINNAYKANPNVLIGIISPGPWGSINPFKTDKMSTLDAHDDATVNDMAINDFAEKYVSTLKDFAKMYSLPFLDLYHESNLRPWNDDFINSYYHGESPTDTTHPNPDAMKKFIAPKIAKFIESFV